MSKKIKRFISTDEMVGLRIDKALALIPEIKTRARASYLIGKGLVKISTSAGQKNKTKSSYVLKSSDQIEIEFPEVEKSELLPMEIKLDILFEDNDIIVVNKPSGLVVHPAAGHAQDTLVNALLAHTKNLSMKFGEDRPGIVHRLDKETSGILVIAKNDFAHENLSNQFKNRTTHRIYEAIVFGLPNKSVGKIETILARHPLHRKKYASIKSTQSGMGKTAITNYKILQSNKLHSLVELKLETGRTHQIRVHLSEIGLPIVGDELYGAEKKIKNIQDEETKNEIKNLNRFLLHAKELGFLHPTSGDKLEFKVEWP